MWRNAFCRARWFSMLVGSAPHEKTDCVVIGAGIIGIAVARELALRGRDVLVVEAASTFGTGASSRNSEVIHAGIYYPPRSLKASFCVRGRDLLCRYCSERQVPHHMIGKLIVATRHSEVERLEELMKFGCDNGVRGLQMLEGIDAIRLEPELQCVKAIFSPCSGIISSHSLMLSLLGDAENCNTTFAYNTTVTGGYVDGGQIYLCVCESKDLESSGSFPLHPQLILVPKTVINCGGLGAMSVAKRIDGLDCRFIPHSYYARGCYFSLAKTRFSPFKHLIYPIPEDGGLGIHVTLDLDGRVKFGPDVEWMNGSDDVSIFLNKLDYNVNANRAGRFYVEIRKYFPNLEDGSLEPAYSGIRVKLSSPGQPSTDFSIQGEETHGVPGLVNLFGIESPGLTSSMAMAEHVATRLCNMV